jgi:type VI secretion system protein VasD
MEILKKWSALALLAALIIGATGCQTARRALDTETTAVLNFSVNKDVNPDGDNRASPLVITVYALKDSRQFEREDFLSLYEGAEKRLGADLVRTVRLREFVPGEKRSENIPLDPSIRYLGVVAEYVQYDKAKTTLVVPIVDHKTNTFELRAEQLGLTVGDGK